MALAFFVIGVQMFTLICAVHDWGVATDFLTIILLVSLMIALRFGFTAKIARWARILWLAVVFAYGAYLGVEVCRFFFSPNTPD